MRVNIGELLADRRAVRTVAFSERFESPAEDIGLLSPVTGELTLVGTGHTVCLTGRVRTVLGLVCSACLRTFEQPLELAVDEEFGRAAPGRLAPMAGEEGQPGVAAAARAETALGPQDFVVPVGPDESVDLSEVVRQQLVLALPLAPRCREECRGLCPTCGADLNVERCACSRQAVDPRLQELQRWRPGSQQRRARERE